MKGEITNRPLLFLILFFVLGILTYGVLNPSLLWIFIPACVLFLIIAVGLKIGWQYTGQLLLVLVFLLGVLTGGWAWKGIDDTLLAYSHHFVIMEGRIDRAPEFRQERIDYVLDVQRAQVGSMILNKPGRVMVRIPGKEDSYGYGDWIRVSGLMLEPRSPGNPGEFDYRQYLARQGIVALVNARPNDIEKVQESFGGGKGWALALRNKIMQLARDTLSPVHAAMLNGMMFGSRGEIPRDLQSAFSESGLAHILCVSGLHVGLVFGGLLFVLRLLGLAASRVPFAATPVLLFYVAMTGSGPAAVRALVMALLLLWGHWLGRERDWPTTLALAALVILAVNPLQLYEVGFQLSFTATWGILYLGPRIKEKVDPWPLPSWVKSILQVTVSAQLATLPIVIFYFNIVSFISIITNLFALPVTGLILLMGFGAGLAGLVLPLAAGVINSGTSILLSALEWLVLISREIPGASLYMAAWPWWGVLVYYGGLVGAVEYRRFKALLPYWGRVKYGVVLLAAAFMVIFVWTGMADRPLEIHFIDVGQGDSILVRLPGGKDMLVDAGGWYGEFLTGSGAGDNVVVPYLQRLGINRLDALVISHFHEDHAGGAGAVLDHMNVRRLLVPSLAGELMLDPNVLGILEQARQENIPVYDGIFGDRLLLDEKVHISVLGPPEQLFAGSRSDPNNNSLVLWLGFKEINYLLTGDIEEEMQNWLVESGKLPLVQVLKVPHHGSKYFSPGFYEQVDTDVAVISVGERNRFHHPAPETIQHLQNAGTTIYRTDRDGAVIVSFDGKKMAVETSRR